MRPLWILIFLLMVLTGLGLLGTFIPDDGLRIGDAGVLHFPSPGSLLKREDTRVDISDILALPTDESAVVDPLTMAVNDTIADPLYIDPAQVEVADQSAFVLDTTALAPLEARIMLHYPDGDRSVLHPFFEALGRARQGQSPMRVMHYGDSQLEGDRITSYVRNKLQSQFGGTGPGLFSVADIVPHMSVVREITPNWRRYSVMSRKDAGLDHTRYGAMSSFSRFTPLIPDTVAVDPVVSEASITLRRGRRAYGKAQEFRVCRIWFGWHRTPLTLTVSIDGEVINTETIQPTEGLLHREWRFPVTPEEITISMSAAHSPEVYGISLEGATGVNVDNIAARGGAGYEFNKVDQALLKEMIGDLDVKLLILQYGGNVLPHMTSVEDADKYGRAFGAQIARFKRMIPGVSVIVIGPSDMSIKEGEDMVTRPFLEDVRDAMKRNSLAQGAAYWDLYEAMGGRGSMASWVNTTPPLAASDFTHFSPQGAKKVGELFYTALIGDLAIWMAGRSE
jgi:hypothetical protein